MPKPINRNTKLREAQSQRCLDLRDSEGLTRLGLHSNQTWRDDPKRLVFTLSRYKFVAKMLAGRQRVLEVGCGDAFGTRIVLDEVGELTAIDFEPIFVADVNERMDENCPFDCRVHDMTEGPVEGCFDAAYALDVLEHVHKDQESRFLKHICDSLVDQSALIIGMPSVQSQAYASELSRQGHVNCKDQRELKKLMQRYFYHVFMFSMNDEVVHTGFYATAHYILALCCTKKNS